MQEGSSNLSASWAPPNTGLIGQARHPATSIDYLDPRRVNEFDEWPLGLQYEDLQPFDAGDFDWFIQNQILPELPYELPVYSFPENPSHSSILGPSRSGNTPGHVGIVSPEVEHDQNASPPIYLQESQSKLLVSSIGEYEAPNCGFRVCNALTDQRRFDLLLALRDIIEIDLTERIFSLNSMKQGIHLFTRNVSIEFSIVHIEILFPSSEESRAAAIEEYGGLARPEIMWAIITFGWSLMKSESGYEIEMAKKIQRALRRTITGVCTALAHDRNFS